MNGNTKIADLTVDEFVSLMREIEQDRLAGSRGQRHEFSWQRSGYGHPRGCVCNPCCQRRANESEFFGAMGNEPNSMNRTFPPNL